MTPEETLQGIADQIDKIIEENYDLYGDNINIMGCLKAIRQSALDTIPIIAEYNRRMFSMDDNE
jgi:hypothetical protein